MDMLREAVETSISKEIEKAIDDAAIEFREKLINNKHQYLKAIMDGIRIERTLDPMRSEDNYIVKIISKQEIER